MKLSNLTIRTLTAIIGIPIILSASFVGDLYFLLLILLFSIMSQLELYRITEIKGAKPQKIPGIISGVFIVAAFFHNKIEYQTINYFLQKGVYLPFPSQAQLLLIVFILSILLILIIELFRNNGSAILNISSTLFGIFYIALFMGTLVGIRELFIPNSFPLDRYSNIFEPFTNGNIEKIYMWGGYTVISIFCIIWICDTMAYFGGMLFGKHKLFERVSPKKTWEGAIAGFIFAIVASILAKYVLLEYLTLIEALIFGLVIGTIGQIGDLVESLIKRDAGVKDSASIIPGHGGFLDRFDSLLFVSPVLYLYLDFIIFS
ncbi:MAG: Phosphatidate cytidylyltransferase [Ignavibacteriae bacterium]|nr:MAG: Phosphatidate cytidylyltransferase [Ignavibacteriota bacterium]